MKKNPRRSRQATRPVASAPPLTDPHLTALLLYIGGATNEDDDGRHAAVFARAARDAQ